MSCTCGVPSEANYYVEIVYGRDILWDESGRVVGTETDYNYGYFCEADKPKPSGLLPDNGPDWPRKECWKVLEHKTKRLR